MLSKALAILLLFSWILLSGVDLLEDLQSARRSTAYNNRATDKSPANSHHAGVANNIIELADQAPLFHASLARVTAVPSPIHRRLSFQKVSELHKLYGVFQI
jgi:hypothetical protein